VGFVTLATILVASLGVLTGCASTTKEGTPPEPVTESLPATETETVSVSEDCHDAFAKYAKAIKRSNRDFADGADPTDYNPDEGPFQVAILKACKSGEEWLAGVEPYSRGPNCVACAAPDDVLAAMCGGGDRKNLPACRD
jgi:hypothetical protein